MESVKNWLGPVGVLLYGVLAWFSGIWLGLTGNKLWALRIGLIAIGLAAVGAILLWLRSRRAAKKAGREVVTSPSSGPDQAEIDSLIRAAAERLKSSKLKMGRLPVIFLAGEPGAGKTTAMRNSGVEPEHLAGQLLQDGAVVPTRPLNIWFARQTLFVEAGGSLLGEPASWARLVRRLAPGKFRSVLGGKGQAARAALVCFDCEDLTKRGASETIGAAVKNLQRRLAEFAQGLGIKLPVYVLFNKIDRLQFFAEYAANLTNPEISEVLGVTLPIEAGLTTGVYAEQQTKRLTAAFEDIFRSLAEKRIEYLPRETQEASWPAIYEFPREFSKLKGLIVQLLVDLCRPSQLTVSPFLRGFYFAGRRTVLVDESGALAEEAPSEALSEAPDAPVGATRVFDVRQLKRVAVEQRAEAPAGATRVFDVRKLGTEGTLTGGIGSQGRETREVQQWVFLSHLFSDVLLQDRAAFGTSGASTKVNFWRRWVLTSAVAVSLVLITGFTVSFFSNRAMVARVGEEAKVRPPDDLAQLESLRQSLNELEQENAHPPLHEQWFLYTGYDLYPAARKAYFDRFRRLLLDPTRKVLASRLRSMPNTKPDYGTGYEDLKAYLIATSNPDGCEDPKSVSAVLLNRWETGRNATSEDKKLAGLQFDFYTDAFRPNNPVRTEADPEVVNGSRSYLAQFIGVDSVYKGMIEAASKQYRAIGFKKDAVSSSVSVEAAFTRDAWTFMQSQIDIPLCRQPPAFLESSPVLL